MLGLQKETSQPEHQLLSAIWFGKIARAAEGNLLTTEAVVERANATKDKEFV